jgi:uncharacterized protein with ATP-grasp and redox domains
VTFVVRGAPIINDVQHADAVATGLTGLVKVIDNGDDAPGTVLASCSPEFLEHFRAADIIISKGQGNYETLNTADQDIFFLLKVKCPVVADLLRAPQGSLILERSGRTLPHE